MQRIRFCLVEIVISEAKNVIYTLTYYMIDMLIILDDRSIGSVITVT